MELDNLNDQHSGIFRRAEDFEIDERPFREIQVDNNRVVARGRSWETFEVLISFIGAAWMEKWRRFGKTLLGGGIFLLVLSFIVMFTIWGIGFFLAMLLMFMGIVLIAVWAYVKREALRIYTPSAVFKIEGSSGFVEAVWKAITSAQRARDM